MTDIRTESIATLRRLTGPAAVSGLLAALGGSAQAGVTVSPAARGYDVDITDQATSAEVLDAIAGATGATIEGDAKDTTVAINHLRNASLERVLRVLLPHAPFVVRFAEDERPAAIIFLSASKSGAAADGGSADDPSAEDGSADDPSADGDGNQGGDEPADSQGDGG